MGLRLRARATATTARPGCTQFRYGQCNQQIATVGRIACRVVSCDPAVLVVGNCAPTVAVDDSTANHNQPCLQQPDPTPRWWVPPEEDDMSDLARVGFNNQVHAFWIDDRTAHLLHKWDDAGGRSYREDLTTITRIGTLRNSRPNVAIAPDGDLLVGVFGTDGAFVEVRYDAQGHAWGALAY